MKKKIFSMFVVAVLVGGLSVSNHAHAVFVEVLIDVPVEVPTLIVKKVLIQDNGGTAVVTDFSFIVQQGDSLSTPETFNDDGENGLILADGNYTVTEPETEGYSTSYEGCSDIVVLADTTQTCTITNDDEPVTLTIIKDTDGGEGSFQFTVTNDDDEYSESVYLYNTDGTHLSEEVSLDAGTYDVLENVPGDWHLADVQCVYDDESFGITIQLGKEISADSGDEVICTFTNTQRATLIIKKVVINDDDGSATADDFSFQVNQNEGTTAFKQNSENALLGENHVIVDEGTYTITEPATEGYTTSYEGCSGEIANLGEAICTITNNDSEPPRSGSSSSSSYLRPTPTPEVQGVSIVIGNSSNLGKYGLKEGDLIGALDFGDPDVYIVNKDGYKRLFLNPIIFSFYGHLGGYGRVKHVSIEARDAFPTSGLFQNCETIDTKVYAVEVTGEDTGIFHWINISGSRAASEDAEFFKKVFCVNSPEFDWYAKSTVDFTALGNLPAYNR